MERPCQGGHPSEKELNIRFYYYHDIYYLFFYFDLLPQYAIFKMLDFLLLHF